MTASLDVPYQDTENKAKRNSAIIHLIIYTLIIYACPTVTKCILWKISTSVLLQEVVNTLCDKVESQSVTIEVVGGHVVCQGASIFIQ